MTRRQKCPFKPLYGHFGVRLTFFCTKLYDFLFAGLYPNPLSIVARMYWYNIRIVLVCTHANSVLVERCVCVRVFLCIYDAFSTYRLLCFTCHLMAYIHLQIIEEYVLLHVVTVLMKRCFIRKRIGKVILDRVSML